MSRSNLTDAVAAIDGCSTDELRQLQALISVRLSRSTASTTRGGGGKKVDGGRRGKTSKGSGVRPKKGNPQRKSQYATHPVYKAYKAAKLAVDKQAKEQKISFKDLEGDARRVYKEALSAWLQTKSGFRGSKKENENSDSESEEDKPVERNRSVDDAPNSQSKTDTSGSVPSPPKRQRAGERRSPSGALGKYSVPPDTWYPGSRTRAEDWSSLSRQDRRRLTDREFNAKMQVDGEQY